MLDVLDGVPCPDPTSATPAEVAKWQRANFQQFSIIFFGTEGSAHITVKPFTGTKGNPGDGAGAWKTLEDSFDGSTKEARRACRYKLFHTTMKSGEDPSDFLAKMDDLRLRLEDMGEKIPDESYEDVLLRALSKEYYFIRQTSHKDRTFGLTEIRTTMVNMYIDELSRKSSGPSVAGRGVAMSAESSNVQCRNCQEFGHYANECRKHGKGKGNRRQGKKPWKRKAAETSGHAVLFLNFKECDELYHFTMDLPETGEISGVALPVKSAALWHRRVGHVHGRSLDILRKVQGNGVEYNGELSACDVCAVGNSKQQNHPKRASYDASRPFQLVTTDLMGPFSPPALGGFLYIKKFVDQHIKWNEVFLMKEKSATVDALQLFNQSVLTPHELRLECVRADKGGEYTSWAFCKYCRDVGIKLLFASTNTPQRIGANERIGRTLAGMVRCLLADSGLPHFLWEELFMTASYLSNRSPHSASDNVTPFKALHGKEAYLGHLWAIGDPYQQA
ncbi:unnamed protein product [Ectocarpus sp. CCAP 1310/34]|nr:unnamed protein product [Ectocarpus sp. CCAP 1310/34]